MGFLAKILADSQHPDATGPGSRLVTMELTYPRVIHAEFMTHRQFSRNSASSRAIPIEKMLKRIEEEPFVPVEWGSNQAGMVAGASVAEPAVCADVWLQARDSAVAHARHLNALGLHKQTVNRIVEPWMWITVIATGVDHAWENFFKLRCAPDAEPHIQKIAYLARERFDMHPPRTIAVNEWHAPLIGFPGDGELDGGTIPKISTARCARVSYLTHDGIRDLNADFKLFDRLASNGHWSPFEHPAQPAQRLHWDGKHSCGNFGGMWHQYRKTFQGEYCKKAPR